MDVANGHGSYRISGKRARGYVLTVLKGEGIREARISLVFVDSSAIRKLNRRFLGRNGTTDVISFPLGQEPLEGEVYVNLDAARIQARRYGVRFGEEMARLVIHGTLHLAGYDDRSAADGRKMKECEENYLSKWF